MKLSLLRDYFSYSPKKGKKDTFFKKSYSQCGEDILVQYIFNLRGIPKPSYIDIGAFDPLVLSNTAILYKKGSKGINVEANPKLIDQFHRFRPNDINLNLGIGSEEGTLEFYIMKEKAHSTFSKVEAENLISNGHEIEEITKVKVSTLSKILEEYCGNKFPDFLSIDVEGLDLDILKSIDFEITAPKVICVEAADYSPIGAGERRVELLDFLVSKGYYEYANTNLNAIMVKRDFWFI
jgi:FkbM family methyltransferase